MMKFCQRCAKKLSFSARGMLCRDCEIARKPEIAKLEAKLSDELYQAEKKRY